MSVDSVLEIVTMILLIASGLLTLLGAIGVWRLSNPFERLHPSALASSGGAWTVGLAALAHFSRTHDLNGAKALLVPLLLGLTVTVTNMLVARAALFRRRVKDLQAQTVASVDQSTMRQ